MAFDLNQVDLQLILFNGSAHEFDRQDPSLFQKSEYERYDIRLEGIGDVFERREEDSYHSNRELGVCELEDVARTARRDEELANRRAAVAERNGLRALLGLDPIEADTAVALPRRSVYCSFWDWIRPDELVAQEPRRQTQAAEDSAAADVSRAIPPPARDVHVTGLRPRPRMNETRVQRDRARSGSVRAANYLVEIHKKYAIPAACIVFVVIGVPAALRFRGGGLGMVIGVGMVIFGVFYIGLIAGEALANKLIVPAFISMWLPNILFCTIGVLALWRYGRQGVVGRGRRAETTQ
jgi:lipopolysaccharide export system permease protein